MNQMREVPGSSTSINEGHAKWPILQQASAQLKVRIPLDPMSLGGLALLTAGVVLESTCSVSEEVPLLVGGVAVSWCEFAVMNGQLAVRLTRLG